MGTVEIRPGVSMAYEDDWFGEPWTAPETVVMVHGNSESSRAWTCGCRTCRGKYRVVRPDLPGFAPPGTAGLRLERASSQPTSDFSWTRSEIERCHLVGAKYGGSACMQFASDQPHRFLSLCLFGSPVRGSGTATRTRSGQGRAAMGRRNHASAPRQHGFGSATASGGPTN